MEVYPPQEDFLVYFSGFFSKVSLREELAGGLRE